jgi:hypothetical protein
MLASVTPTRSIKTFSKPQFTHIIRYSISKYHEAYHVSATIRFN